MPAESKAAQRHNGIGSPCAPMHPGTFESCADGILASGFHHAGGRAESLDLELGVTHAMSILVEIAPGRFSLSEVEGLGGEDRKQGLDPTGIEFLTTLLGPLLPGLAVGIQTLGERMESFFGVESIDDLHRLREELAAEVPNPLCSVSEDDLPRCLPETAALGLALQPSSELRKLGVRISPWQKSSRHSTVPASRRTALRFGHILPVCTRIAPCPAGAGTASVLAGLSPRAGIQGGGNLDGCGVGDRARVALGSTLRILSFGTPDHTELGFPGSGRPIGLFAHPSPHLGRSHRHPGAVQTQIERRGQGKPQVGLPGLPLIVRGLLAQGPGRPLDLFGPHLDSRQLVQ